MLKFNERNNSFILFTNDDARAIAAGLTLSTDIRGPRGERVYYTADHAQHPEFNPYSVLEFYEEADDIARGHLCGLMQDYCKSWADAYDIIVPSSPGMEYMPYQSAGIAYARDTVNCVIVRSDGRPVGKASVRTWNTMR